MISDEYIKQFYTEVCKTLDGEYKIIWEPPRNIKEEWIEYDQVKWEIEDSMKDIVDKLLEDKLSSLEDKIMILYNFICLHYIYDANVLYFFKRDLTDPNNPQYIAVDWYGRIVGKEWIQNRKNHNRRICYEFSRFYAKAINILIGKNEELEAFMLGDKENLHYVVALTGKDYSVILDLDDFNSVKDLTRLKLGLTIKGIHILRDEKNKFQDVVNKFNKNRPTDLQEVEEAKKILDKGNLIDYFNAVISIIKKYNIDPQGFFEYMRKLIESLNIKIEKIWKEDKKAIEKRYERCLYFEYNGKTYLLDSIAQTLSIINIEDLDKNIFVFNPEENIYSYSGK